MKISNEFINALQERKSRYLNPEQPETLYKALLQLSSGIYAEEERFIYELLQNADDSIEDGQTHLDVRIVVKGDYFIFMHNGAPFTERDVEGICDIGNGNKENEKNKTGYKGIGFKSVFGHSDCVTIQTSGVCFKFDRSKWNGFWDESWGEEWNNQKKVYHLPWQLIPMICEAPININTDKFSVITYIRAKNIAVLSEKVSSLLKDPKILLFLRSRDISVSLEIEGESIIEVKKEECNGIVSLTLGDSVNSKWIMARPKPFIIDQNIKNAISEDFNTPDKIKDADATEISLAISLDENNQIQAKPDSLVYSFLPTSESFGFPFIVNANFILDASRQHLNKDSAWNKFLLSLIPEVIFSILRQINKNELYPDSWYHVLPKPKMDGELFDKYNTEIQQQLISISFVPNIKGDLQTVGESLVESTGIAEAFGATSIIDYINAKYAAKFSEMSLVSPVLSDALDGYGIRTFKFSDLKPFLEDSQTSIPFDQNNNLEFIKKLYIFDNNSNEKREEFREAISEVKFVLSSKGSLNRPSMVRIKSGNPYIDKDLILICDYLNDNLENKEKKWLKTLGMGKVGDTKFIKDVILKDPTYITISNVLEVGKMIFESFSKGAWSDDDLQEIGELPFLTTKGNLKPLNTLFLSSSYRPDFDIEPLCDQDIFVSKEYLQFGTRNELTVFFHKAHVIREISFTDRCFTQDHLHKLDIYQYDSLVNRLNTQYSSKKYPFHFKQFYFKYLPLDIARQDNTALLEHIFRYALTKGKPLLGECAGGYYGLELPEYYSLIPLNNKSEFPTFIDFAFKNWQKFPCLDGSLRPMSEVFANEKDIVDIAGHYLPIFSVETYDESWNSVLNFKSTLRSEDYLQLLYNISKDPVNAEANKKRITKIYKILADNFYKGQINEEVIKHWSNKIKLLADDWSFYPAEELSFIRINGFDENKKVFCENIEDKKVEDLLKALGVKIITEDNLKVITEGKVRDTAIDERLHSIFSFLLVVAGKDTADSQITLKEKLNLRIENIKFYQCEKITLILEGYSSDSIKRQTFAQGGDFYYTGKLRTTSIESILTPLCSYLGMDGKEREMFIMLVENDRESIIDNLKDKGYDVEGMEKNTAPLPYLLGLVSPKVAEENEDLKRRIAELESMLNWPDGTIRGGSASGLEDRKKLEAQLEAQNYLKIMKPDWKFPDGYGERDDDGKPCCNTQVRAHTPDGDKYFVLKSHKAQSAPFKITVPEWDYISNHQAKIFVYTGSDIREIDPEDLVRNQSTVSISFSTKNLDVEEKIHDFARAMHYFKGLHFDFDSFDLSSKAASIRGLYNKLSGEQIGTTDFDL